MLKQTFSVLIADDDKDILNSVNNYLCRFAKQFKDDIRVYCASSAAEILGIYSDIKINAIILDYHFEGGMSGDEIIDKIADPFGKTLIVLMSGRERKELEGIIIKRFRNLGDRFKFLRKPFDHLQIQAIYLEIQKHIASQPYPFTLAYAYDSFSKTTTSQGKVTALKDLVESITKYSVSILLADILHTDKANKIKIDLLLRSGITFGAWITWLHNILEYFDKNNKVAFIPELLEFFRNCRHGNTKLIDFLRKFKNEIRDLEIGHGYLREEGWYENIANEYAPIIEYYYRQLSFISKYQLLVPEKIDFDENNFIKYTIRQLMGTDIKFPLVAIDLKIQLKLSQVYLYEKDDKILSLHPFLLHNICNNCSCPRLYMIEDINQTHVVYNAFCNHRLFDKKNLSILNSQLSSK